MCACFYCHLCVFISIFDTNEVATIELFHHYQHAAMRYFNCVASATGNWMWHAAIHQIDTR